MNKQTRAVLREFVDAVDEDHLELAVRIYVNNYELFPHDKKFLKGLAAWTKIRLAKE
jgi:hypothetical protein